MAGDISLEATGKVIQPEDYPSQLATSMIAFHLAMKNGMVSTPIGKKVMKSIGKVHVYRDTFEPVALPMAVGLLRMLDDYAADNGASCRKFWNDVWAAK